MYKNIIKLIAVVFLLFGTIQLTAQNYVITPQIPPSPFIGIEDLWNFSVLAPANSSLNQAKITIVVTDGDGKTVLTTQSSAFTLPGGNSHYTKFTMNGLKPVQNQISADGQYANIHQNGIFPSGSYLAAYSLTGINQGGDIITSPIFETTFSVDLLFPPTLLTPANDDTLNTYTPMFTWAPAFSGAQRISYDIVIAEQYPGQSAEQAVNANPAYFKAENILITSLLYPFSARQFKPNQWYAWRIIAKVGNVPASRSETWRFIIVEPKDDPCLPKPVDFYYQLQEKPTGNFAKIINGQLNFYFNEVYKATHSDLKFNIYNNKTNKVVASNKTIERSYGNGLNYHTILLTQNDASLPKGLYTLEVFEEKNRKLYFRFELVNDVNPRVNE